MGLRPTKADERPQARNRAATARERSSACFSRSGFGSLTLQAIALYL